MADHTHIEWTDATWNPITGCDVVSPGCTNCYAMQLAATRLKDHPSRAGLTKCVNGNHVWTGEVRFNEQWLTQPLHWHKPRRVFVCAHGDLFHEDVPDKWIDRVFAVMALAPQHQFQVLTKRSARMRAYLASEERRLSAAAYAACWHATGRWAMPYDISLLWPLPNVWLGVSVEDQARANERIPDLLATPAVIRWVSAEPLLGPVDFGPFVGDPVREMAKEDAQAAHLLREALADGTAWVRPSLDWIVAGGESGPKARPAHPDWFRSIRDQCAAAGVPFLFKQWGAWAHQCCDPDGDWNWADADERNALHIWDHGYSGASMRVGKKAAGRTLDGVVHDGFPTMNTGGGE